MKDGWILKEQNFSVDDALAWEGVFTQGSGYLHIRGSLEEHFQDAPQNLTNMRMPGNVTVEKFAPKKAQWGTFVPGIFGKHPFFYNEMINLPWFIGISIKIDNECLSMDQCLISDYVRHLDLGNGLLTRSFVWKSKSGKSVRVCFERFISMAMSHLCAQRLTLEVLQEGRVEIISGIDADIRTCGFDHMSKVSFEKTGDSSIHCQHTTDNNDVVDIVSLLRCPFELGYKEKSRSAAMSGSVAAVPGSSIIIEKRTAVCTSLDLETERPQDVLDRASGKSFDSLLEESTKVWTGRWKTSDVEIDGDPESQLHLRTCIYHLLRCHVPSDDRVAIDAKGYAGDAYFGHFFWDTEMYMLPFYLYTDPERARTFTDFRIKSLAGAQENAREYGYPGARFAWESDHLGRESCAKGNWQYRDNEVHITADVVYGIVHYVKATNDDKYLRENASLLLAETARYWLSRIDYRRDDNIPSLLGVMGPDEYTPFSSNNSYTNRMVSLNLETAARYADKQATEQERREWERVARTLPVVKNGKLVMQCEDFEKLAEPCFDLHWKDRTKPFAAQVSQERLYRTKCSKQADVLMLMLLFPSEYTKDEMKAAWDYYVPYGTHDSSLSYGIHALMALRLDLHERAWEFWKNTSRIDLDIQKGGAAQGIHIANAAAAWMVAVQGFAGLCQVMETDVFTLNPQLPSAWKSILFPVVWKGIPVVVHVSHSEVSVINEGQSSLRVIVKGEVQTISPGERGLWR